MAFPYIPSFPLCICHVVRDRPTAPRLPILV
jgi:hypothetical protein